MKSYISSLNGVLIELAIEFKRRTMNQLKPIDKGVDYGVLVTLLIDVFGGRVDDHSSGIGRRCSPWWRTWGTNDEPRSLVTASGWGPGTQLLRSHEKPKELQQLMPH